jgi:carbonic anhydrase
MSAFPELLCANVRFAATDAKDRVPRIPFLPNKQVYLITCIDPRVDPAALLALDLGDAIVARNVGGRVTEAVLADVAWISYLHEVKTPDAPWFEIGVIHHTDCGSSLMADDDLRAGFADRGFDAQTLSATAVVDPSVTVTYDVARIAAASTVSDRIRISGFVYDVRTGLLTDVTEPSRDVRGAL